jgi:GMP synthase-like glutamine amidotransferase
MNIGIIGGGGSFEKWLGNLESNINFINLKKASEEEQKRRNVNKMGMPNKAKIDLVVFTGGADVSPRYYGDEQGKFTTVNEKRDAIEENYYAYFRGIPKLGICRGSQFLTVMNGGKLIQHVTGHTQSHTIHLKVNEWEDPNDHIITSTHHQMLYPFDCRRYELLAWSKEFRSNTYLNGQNKEFKLPSQFLEPEIVYYPDSNSLAIQGHPEFDRCPKTTSEMCLTLIKKFLLK